MSEWRNFGPVAGVFWIGRLGIAVRTAFVFGHHRIEGATMYRYWPFVFVWVDHR